MNRVLPTLSLVLISALSMATDIPLTPIRDQVSAYGRLRSIYCGLSEIKRSAGSEFLLNCWARVRSSARHSHLHSTTFEFTQGRVLRRDNELIYHGKDGRIFTIAQGQFYWYPRWQLTENVKLALVKEGTISPSRVNFRLIPKLSLLEKNP